MRVSRRGDVDPFIVMDVLARAAELEAEGRRIIHMEVGQPGTAAPAGARAAARDAMESQTLGYTGAAGLPALRARISRLYGDWYDVDLDPKRVLVTAGASGAFSLAFASLFEAGDRVGMGVPGYPSYRQILKAMALDPVLIETRENRRFQPGPEDVAGAGLDGLIVASPGNPTGTMLDRAAQAELAAACAAEGTALIADEIYHGLHYDARAHTALEVTDEVYVINSFSKYFSMTGWRVGWMVVPEDHVRRVERLAQHFFICASHPSQVAALAAMDCTEELEMNRAVYAKNRALLLEGLPKAGFDRIAPPDGGFYVYAEVSELTSDTLAFCHEVLETTGVAITPGLDFDPGRGNAWVRFSYAASTPDIEEALDRLTRFMAAR